MMQNKIVKTITACVPGTACNFKCSYCYIGSCCDEDHRIPTKFQYSVEHMVKAFNPKRLGGYADIIVIGNGETLIPPEVVPFIKGLLKQGHVVEVATNLTLNNRVEELLQTDKEDLKRLVMRPSFHYHELKRLNKIDDFFNNLNKFYEAGASCIPFMVICKEYMNDLDEIRDLFINKFGSLPQVTPTLAYEEKTDIKRGGHVKCDPEITPEFKQLIKEKFNSNVFDLCCDYLDVDPKKVFCRAGECGFCVTLDNGNVQRCHACPSEFSMFKNLKEKIDLGPIGNNCCINTCAMQYQFIASGFLDGYSQDTTHYTVFSGNGRSSKFNETAKELLNFNYSKDVIAYSEEQKNEINKKVKDEYALKNLGHVSWKNKIRYKIYKYLENKLQSKGIIKD